MSLARWPFRRLPLDEPPALVDRLRALGVTQTWAGSFDAILHRDVAAVNARLAADCERHGKGFLLPVGCVNPALPDWEEDLRRCHEEFGMPGVRLHPNYHSYTLDGPVFERLLTLCAERDMLVQLAVSMEDERTMHPLVRVPPVDLAPLAPLLGGIPGLRVVLLGAHRSLRGRPLRQLAEAGEVYFDLSTLEGVGGVAGLLETLPADRVLFSSHAPLFYPEAAVLKLKESMLLPEQASQVAWQNAQRALRRREQR